MMFSPSTYTRLFRGSVRSTRPVLPRSLPPVTTTVSSLRIFIAFAIASGASFRGSATQPAKTEPGKDAASVAGGLRPLATPSARLPQSTPASEDAGWRRFAAGWGVLSWEESSLQNLRRQGDDLHEV